MTANLQERLRQLQMADLGTGRREYISTVDDPKKVSRAQLEELEAARKSNIVGTAAARLAKQDKDRLTEWANLHKTIGDTRGLEDLNDLMSGQSHRAHLNATIQAAGGQQYSRGQAKGHAKAKGHHPIPAGSSGRGGGVVGTRGRGNSSPSSKPLRSERRAVTQRLDMPPLQRLDPALDINNGGAAQRGSGANRGHGKRRREETSVPGPAKKGVPGLDRVKRPMIDFSRNLSTPEAFLTVARQNFRVGPATAGSPSSGKSEATSAAGPRLGPPNLLGHTKIVIRPGLGPSPTTSGTDTPVTGRPVSKASAPSPSTPKVTDTSVSKRPASKAPETPTPLARAQHVHEAITEGTAPAPVSQRISAETRLREAGAAPGTSPAPKPTINAQVARESVPDTDLPKPSDDAGKNDSVDLLLDVDAPAEASGPEPQNQIMSPSCADLTGLDFPSGDKSRVTSPPSTPLTQRTTRSPVTNIRSELWKSLHKLVETSRLAQQLIDTAHGTRDGLFENFFNALVLGSGQAEELAAEITSNPQPSSAGRSLVEGWLSHTLADRAMSPNQKALGLAKGSFDTYRSPANSESSSGSAQKRSPDSLTPGLSPRKIAASEGVFGIENLRLSDETPETFPLAASKITSRAKHSRAVSSLAQSIHAAPSVGGYNPERPKIMGSHASHSKEYQASARGSFFTSTTGSQTGGVHSVTARGPAPAVPPGLGPFAPYNQTTHVEATPESSKSGRSTGPKIIGVAPYEPKPTGPKIIGVASYEPKDTGPKVIGVAPHGPERLEPAGAKIIGVRPYEPKGREAIGPKVIGFPPFMPNYPVVQTSTDTAQADAHRAISPQTSSTPGPAQHQRKPSVIGPMPYTPCKSIYEDMTIAEPLSSGSSNVPKEASASASPGPKYRPSPLSQYLGESILSSAWTQESYKTPAGTARQPEAQTSTHVPQAENKAPPKVRVIGPQPYVPKN